MNKYRLVLLAFCMWQCSSQQSSEDVFLQEMMQTHTIPQEVLVIYAVSVLDCPSCVKKTADFATQVSQVNPEKVYFLLSDVAGKKTVSLNYGKDFSTLPNLVLNPIKLSTNLPPKEVLVDSFVLFLDKDKRNSVKEKIFITPQNQASVHDKIKKYLTDI
jgi:hypothetical protein